jgi:hypothetical protein
MMSYNDWAGRDRSFNGFVVETGISDKWTAGSGSGSQWNEAPLIVSFVPWAGSSPRPRDAFRRHLTGTRRTPRS